MMECFDEYEDPQSKTLTNSSLTLKEFQSSVVDSNFESKNGLL